MGEAARLAIAELTGGLGNQLFQYAAARALALRESRRLRFAFHTARTDTPRRFMLDAFRLAPGVPRAPLGRAEACLLGLRSPLVGRRPGATWRRLWGGPEQLDEHGFAFAPLASEAPRVVLHGYFQSWRYFADAEDAVRAELVVAEPALGANAILLRRMREENPVCLHVRRGDYASNPVTTAYHGLLGIPYYQAAIESLGESARDATFYVFSDDPAWARENLHTDRPTVFVDHNGVDAPWEDLRLMRSCRHFVIANSSLSWWGAFLSEHEGGRVVAPRRWFAQADIDTRDLCPPRWERL